MNRLDKGSHYYFIGNITHKFKVCETNDCYFPTDNERWENNNYFLNGKAANACSTEIKETFLDRLNELEAERENNKRNLIKETLQIAERARKSKFDKEGPVELLKQLVQHCNSFEDAKKEIAKEIKEIQENIEKLIKKAPKQ